MIANARTDIDCARREQVLVETNVIWLRQALDLLEELDDDAFVRAPIGQPRHRVSAHLRHIIEFYDCFLSGLTSAYIDYDARRRDHLLEKSRAAAARRIHELIESLQDHRLQNEDFIVMVRMEDADQSVIPGGWLPSSINRELQALSSHTIHHFALISMTLHALGIGVDPHFGVSPSTLSHESRRTRASEAA